MPKRKIAPSEPLAKRIEELVGSERETSATAADLLGELARLGAQRVIQEALEHEQAEHLERDRYERRTPGSAALYRNGYEPRAAAHFAALGRAARARAAGCRPPPDQIYRALTAAWQRDTLVVRWNDVHPGRLVPANGPVLRVDRRTQTGWLPVTWDDDRALEVWALGDLGQAGYQWEARWSPATLPVAETRIVLLARPGLPQVTSAPLPPPARMGPVR